MDNYKITGIYQWVMPLEKGFNWYAGPSLGLGIIDFDRKWPRFRDDYSTLYLALGGDIGIEYIFAEVPIQLALDLRPEICGRGAV
ncbi:MAG: hypothetical protein U5L96_21560 [Owenweeksia sp.]|nr:hypothetical protein [Owenweeksia sp.]